ncbi:polyprenyl synthetase family protein [Paramicrobacterium sp. CJ85]|uniref:polyprenyl synthetase family protein n=1 Tax=Paramicrobacterium sp. CJ85 TaxID=3445355 RepID=UPI003F63564C
MPDPQPLLPLIQNRLDSFLRERTSILSRVSEETAEFSAFSRNFLSGGKRFRGRFCHQGWRAITGRSAESSSETIVGLASALEIFHAAALVHDDIIDNSDTRRGRPSAHRAFQSQHRAAAWNGDSGEYGRSAAILLGDLLLGWSDELLDEALSHLDDHARAASTRAEFTRMRTEVTAGQFLDILEEQAWADHADDEQLTRAEAVITYKSAKYSVEAPVAIGALSAGATTHQLAALRSYGLPLGRAYQLRDDLLGVFGDSAVTGKPSGDDLREGKRTVLISLTRSSVSAQDRELLDRLLGDPTLTDNDIAHVQSIIRTSGAEEQIEQRIAAEAQRAVDALTEADLDAAAVRELSELAESVAQREA